ncbi:MAG: hypothetical protein OXC62_10470 [Aestuariivita sp.]|nr:hypothetical protein [Aestuariivita sp.]
MSAASVKPKTVLESILKWSEKRPLWQRDALRRIIAEGNPAKETVDELLALCKKEYGDISVTQTAKPLAAMDLPVDPGEGESISLINLSDVVGVNQLASDQTLAFEPNGLTVIYGPNGSGKSGYTRILKKACRARHAGDIMPDIYKPSPTGNATANLTVSNAKGDLETLNWEDSVSRSDKLSAITVFDRDCGTVHVRQKKLGHVPSVRPRRARRVGWFISNLERSTNMRENPIKSGQRPNFSESDMASEHLYRKTNVEPESIF